MGSLWSGVFKLSNVHTIWMQIERAAFFCMKTTQKSYWYFTKEIKKKMRGRGVKTLYLIIFIDFYITFEEFLVTFIFQHTPFSCICLLSHISVFYRVLWARNTSPLKLLGPELIKRIWSYLLIVFKCGKKQRTHSHTVHIWCCTRLSKAHWDLDRETDTRENYFMTDYIFMSSNFRK